MDISWVHAGSLDLGWKDILDTRYTRSFSIDTTGNLLLQGLNLLYMDFGASLHPGQIWDEHEPRDVSRSVSTLLKHAPKRDLANVD
jgi:hypothetical protein